MPGLLLHTAGSSCSSSPHTGHGQRRLLRDESLGLGGEVQGGDRREEAERSRAAGRDHPGGLCHWDIFQGQLAVLGEETRGEQSSPLQDGCPLYPHLTPGPRHPGERRNKNVKIMILK